MGSSACSLFAGRVYRGTEPLSRLQMHASNKLIKLVLHLQSVSLYYPHMSMISMQQGAMWMPGLSTTPGTRARDARSMRPRPFATVRPGVTAAILSAYGGGR